LLDRSENRNATSERGFTFLVVIWALSMLVVLSLVFGASVSAQSPTYHFGRTPTPDEIRAWDISISPDGHELPPGHGTAKEGRDLFIEKGCSQCHGRMGEGGRAPTLIVMKGMPTAPGRPMPGTAPMPTPMNTAVYAVLKPHRMGRGG